MAAVEEAAGDPPADGILAIVTHSDIVRLLLCHYLGVSLASYARFRVAVASVSTVSLSGGGKAKVLGVNWRSSLQDTVEGTGQEVQAVRPASQPVTGVNPARSD